MIRGICSLCVDSFPGYCTVLGIRSVLVYQRPWCLVYYPNKASIDDPLCRTWPCRLVWGLRDPWFALTPKVREATWAVIRTHLQLVSSVLICVLTENFVAFLSLISEVLFHGGGVIERDTHLVY